MAIYRIRASFLIYPIGEENNNTLLEVSEYWVIDDPATLGVYEGQLGPLLATSH